MAEDADAPGKAARSRELLRGAPGGGEVGPVADDGRGFLAGGGARLEGSTGLGPIVSMGGFARDGAAGGSERAGMKTQSPTSSRRERGPRTSCKAHYIFRPGRLVMHKQKGALTKTLPWVAGICADGQDCAAYNSSGKTRRARFE